MAKRATNILRSIDARTGRRLTGVARSLLQTLSPEALVPMNIGSFSFGASLDGGLTPPEFTRLFKGYVFACTLKRAEAVASLSWKVYRKSPKTQGGLELAEPDNWLVKLLDTPNKADKSLTRINLLTGLELWMCGFGKNYWWTPKNGTKYPVQIWEIPAPSIWPVPMNGKLMGAFQWSHPTLGMTNIPSEEVVFFRQATPRMTMWENLTAGYSLMHACADALIVDANTMEYLRNDLDNGLMPPYFVTAKGRVDPDEWKKWRDKLVEAYQGSGGDRTPAMLPNDWGVQEVDLLGNKQSLLAMGEHNLKIIGAVTGVPSGIITGEFQARAPAASYEALRYTFHQNTIDPRAVYYGEILSNWAQGYDPQLVVKHEPIIWQDPVEVRADEEHRLDTGQVTINELLKENGKDPIDPKIGDVRWIDPKRVPIDEVLAGRVQPPAQTKVTVNQPAP